MCVGKDRKATRQVDEQRIINGDYIFLTPFFKNAARVLMVNPIKTGLAPQHIDAICNSIKKRFLVNCCWITSTLNIHGYKMQPDILYLEV